MRIDGLADVAGTFDGMLIDQFGVIHDGRALYPGALEALSNLKRMGIPVAVLTNSGQRAEANRRRLVQMGVPRDHFTDAVSSGEVAFHALRSGRAFLIGKRGVDYGFAGMDFVDDPQDADFLLILGSNAPETSLDDYRMLLGGLTLPAICCNPDKLMLTAEGLQPAPGAIAALYESMGGAVTWVGKPHGAIYRHALSVIGAPRRVLCIGDSAEHDVAGGKAAGLATLLVQQGVSAGIREEEINPRPDYIAAAFRW